MDCSPPGSSVHGDSLGKNTEVDCHFLLQVCIYMHVHIPVCVSMCIYVCIYTYVCIYSVYLFIYLEWVAFLFSRGTSPPRDRTQVSLIFTRWATGKPKNTGVGSLSLLQWIFPTQESNQGLLHCRQILYQLSCQGSLCVFIHKPVTCTLLFPTKTI